MRSAIVACALLLLGAAPAADGRHDFDFEVGAWSMSPSGNTHLVERLWDGATIARLVVAKPAPHVRGSLLSIYDPAARVWRVYWADTVSGKVDPPLVGHFARGVGTFVGRTQEAGRSVLVRLVYFHIAERSFQTSQSTSRDGGATWDRTVLQTYTKKG